MHPETLEYYQNHAAAIASDYRQVDFSSVRQQIITYLPHQGRLLELGCGSGRDAAAFLDQGYDVLGVDASPAMLTEARRCYPQLEGRLICHNLPQPLPLPPAAWAVVYAMATLMHLSRADFETTLAHIWHLLQPEGVLAFSVTTARPSLDSRGMDAKGRLFNTQPLKAWADQCLKQWFDVLDQWESADITNRPGITWGTLVARKT